MKGEEGWVGIALDHKAVLRKFLPGQWGVPEPKFPARGDLN